MSLNADKLEKVVELASGGRQARCPACAETGNDRRGEHLRISPHGKFGCCVYPRDHQHRKRIFALAGEHEPKAIKVRVASAKSAEPIQLDLLGRLGRVFQNAECRMESAELETRETEEQIGTVGTGFSDLRACKGDQDHIYKLKEFDEPVPNVPTVEHGQQLETGVPSVPTVLRLPHLLGDGTLVIPFNSPERYHWWKRGQSVRETRAELQQRMKEKENGTPF